MKSKGLNRRMNAEFGIRSAESGDARGRVSDFESVGPMSRGGKHIRDASWRPGDGCTIVAIVSIVPIVPLAPKKNSSGKFGVRRVQTDLGGVFTVLHDFTGVFA